MPELATALDRLAHAAAHTPDTPATRTARAAAVTDLERAAHAGLGPAGHDPLVVLQRRLGRAHARLAATPGAPEAGALEAGVVLGHLRALCHPQPHTCPPPATAPDRHAAYAPARPCRC